MKPQYDIDKIKFSTDVQTFQRAIGLYESGKITQFQETPRGFEATVLGTQPYHVVVSANRYDHGNCDCYLGQQDILCKHMVAVALRAASGGRLLRQDEKALLNQPVCSGRRGEMGPEEFLTAKRTVTAHLRYIKSYEGPSRVWFAYQNSLQEGCRRLTALVSDLPASEQTAHLLVDLLLRLDKKLCVGGVDDSDGTVSEFIEGVVRVLEGFLVLDPACKRAFHILENIDTCFGWEEPLLKDRNDPFGSIL